MTTPEVVKEPTGKKPAAREAAEGEREYTQVTATISLKGERGREIYIYLDRCDELDYTEANGNVTTLAVKVNMKGHRHWEIKLSPNDALGTGHPDPPPPPPGPLGG